MDFSPYYEVFSRIERDDISTKTRKKFTKRLRRNTRRYFARARLQIRFEKCKAIIHRRL